MRALLTVSSGFVITAARQCDHYKPVHVVVDTSDADGDIPSFLTGFEHARLMGLSKTDVKILARCTGSNQARMSEIVGNGIAHLSALYGMLFLARRYPGEYGPERGRATAKCFFVL